MAVVEVNLPACRVSRPTLTTIQWHFDLAHLMAAEADALADADRPLSVPQFAAQCAAEVYMREWARLAAQTRRV